MRIARAAAATASRPEPQSRLTVAPGTLDRQTGQQDRHARDVAVVLAGLVGAAEMTSSTAAQSTLRLRAISALIGTAAEIVGAHRRSAPP